MEEIQNIKVGDMIKSSNGYTTVSSMERIDKESRTVYLETESGNYVVVGDNGAYIVHGKYQSSLVN